MVLPSSKTKLSFSTANNNNNNNSRISIPPSVVTSEAVKWDADESVVLTTDRATAAVLLKYWKMQAATAIIRKALTCHSDCWYSWPGCQLAELVSNAKQLTGHLPGYAHWHWHMCRSADQSQATQMQTHRLLDYYNIDMYCSNWQKTLTYLQSCYQVMKSDYNITSSIIHYTPQHGTSNALPNRADTGASLHTATWSI